MTESSTESRENISDFGLINSSVIMRSIWCGKQLICITTFATMLLALLYVWMTPPGYLATASLFVDPRELSITKVKDVVPGLGRDTAAVSSQVEVLSSRDILMPVFESFRFDSNFDGFRKLSLHSRLNGLIHGLLGKEVSDPTSNYVFDNFLKKIEIERVGLTYVIEVRFTGREPEFAANVANAIVDSYIKSQLTKKIDATTDVSSRMAKQLTTLRSGLARSEKEAMRFRAEKGLVDVKTVTLIDEQIVQTNTSLLAAQTRLSETKSRLETIRRLGTSPEALDRITGLVSSPAANNLRTHHDALTLSLRRQSSRLADGHPAIVALKEELAEVRSLRKRETQLILRKLESEVAQLQTEAAAQTNELDRLTKRQSNLAEASIKLDDMERSALAQRAVLVQFLQRSNETNELSTLQTPNAHIITRSTPPSEPAWPKPVLILFVAGILGAALGSLGTLVRTQMRTRQEFEESSSHSEAEIPPDFIPLHGRLR